MAWAWIATLAVLMGTGEVHAQTAQTVGTTSGILTATVKITGAGTSANSTAVAIPVLTQGIAGLDFNLASGGTCAANTAYTVGETCTVNYTFTPAHPWARYGGIEVVSSTGTVLGNTFVYGTGNGPQAAYSLAVPTAPVTLGGGGFYQPTGIALDAGGNIFVADLNNNTVYEILAAGGYTTINTLGGGFNGPSTVAIDGSGNIYVANANDRTVSEMPPGCASAACVVSLGGGFTRSAGVAVDGNGNVYVADYNNQAVTEMPPNCFSTSCMTNLGGGFMNPRDVAVDGAGNVYVVDPVNVALTRMPAGCTNVSCVTTMGGGFNNPQGVAVDGTGNVYVADQNNSAVKEVPPNCFSSSCVVTLGGSFSFPVGVALDGSGNIYVINQFYRSVQKLDVQDAPSLTFAGTPAGNSSSALVVTLSNNGNLPLTISSLSVTNASLGGTTTCDTSTVVAAGAACNLAVEFIPPAQGPGMTGSASITDNTLYVSPNLTQTIQLSGTGTGSGNMAQTISFPAPVSPVQYGVAPVTLGASASSGLPVSYAITGPATVSGSTLIINGSGTVTIIASQDGNSTYAAAVSVTQSIFVSSGPLLNVGTSSGTLTATLSFNSTGTLGSTLSTAIQVVTKGATGLDFNYVSGGSCAPGMPYTPSTTCTVWYTFTPMHPWMRYGGIQLLNSAGSVVSSTFLSGMGNGAQTTFALSTPTVPKSLGSGFVIPWGLAVDGGGNIYVGDSVTLVPNTGPGNGFVYEIPAAGGPIKTLGGIYAYPNGLAVDGVGNVYVTDAGNSTVREIPPGCVISSCVVSLGGDWRQPLGIAVDQSGNVYVADLAATIVKMPPNCFSTSCMMILGGGFAVPYGVAVDGGGNIYVADHYSGVISEMPASCVSASCVVPLGGIFSAPDGIAVDGGGNVYVAGHKEVVEIPSGCFTAGCMTTLGSGFAQYPLGMAVDGGGNIFFALSNTATVDEIDVQDPPSLSFSSTPIGTPSAPQPVTLGNDGNLPLTISALTLANASLDTGTTCTTSSVIASGAACALNIEFTPTTLGNLLTGSVSIADNNLFNPGATQVIALTGGGVQQTPLLTLQGVATVAYGSNSLLSVTLAWTGTGSAPTGAVTFSVDGGSALAATCVGTASPITCTYSSSFAVGSHTLDTSYAGDTNYTAATASQISFSVGKQIPVLTLSAVTAVTYPNASVLSVSLAWTGIGAAPTGAVTFSADGGSALAATCVGTTSPIICTYSGSFVPGSHTLNAAYAGDTNYATVAATQTSFTVGKQTATMTLSVVAAVTYPNDSMLSVSLAWTGIGAAPTGVVSFSVDGGSALAATCVGTTSPVTCTYSGSFVPGSHTLNAAYAGDTNYAAAVATPISFTVISSQTKLVFGTLPLSPISVGGNGGSAVTVQEETPSNAIATTATDPITLTVTGPAGYGTRIYGPTTSISGVATFNVSASVLTVAGNYTYTATFGSLTSAVYTEVVVTGLAAATATPTISLTQNHLTTAFAPVVGSGGVGTLVYTVLPGLPAGLSYSTQGIISGTPTVTSTSTPYTVTVTDSNSATVTATFSLTVYSAVLATQAIAATDLVVNQATSAFVPVIGSGGFGSLSYSVLPASPGGLSFSSTSGTVTGTPTAKSPATTYSVTVTDANQASASNNFTLEVDAGTPTIVFTVPNHIYGDPAFNVSATSNSTGAFTYSVMSGPATISGSTVTLTGAGVVTLQASEAADANYNAATKDASFTVSATSLSIVANNASRLYGAANPTFTGSVSGALPGDSFAESFATSAVTLSPAGLYPIVPSVSGANVSAYTENIVNGTLTVTQAPTSINLSASGTSVAYGQTITFTVQVLPSTSGTPSGTITLLDNGNLLATLTVSGGSTSYVTSALSPGITHILTATYGGDSNFLGSTTNSNTGGTTVTVGGTDFSLTLTSGSSFTLSAGRTVNFGLLLTPLNRTYPLPVTLAISGLPPGAIATFAPAGLSDIPSPASVLVTIQTASSTGKLDRMHGNMENFALALLLVPLGFIGRARKRLSKTWVVLTILFVGFLSSMLVTGCGSRSAVLNSHTYALSITASSVSVMHTATVTLAIQ